MFCNEERGHISKDYDITIKRNLIVFLVRFNLQIGVILLTLNNLYGNDDRMSSHAIISQKTSLAEDLISFKYLFMIIIFVNINMSLNIFI